MLLCHHPVETVLGRAGSTPDLDDAQAVEVVSARPVFFVADQVGRVGWLVVSLEAQAQAVEGHSCLCVGDLGAHGQARYTAAVSILLINLCRPAR